MYVPLRDTGPLQAQAPSLDSSSRFVPPSDLPAPPYAAENRLSALEGNLKDDAISSRAWKMLRSRKATAETNYIERMSGAEERRQNYIDERVAQASADLARVHEVTERMAATKRQEALEFPAGTHDGSAIYFTDSIMRSEAAAERRQRALEEMSVPAGIAFDQAMQVHQEVVRSRGREDEHRRLANAEEEAKRAQRLQEQAAVFKEEEERLNRRYQEENPASPALPPSGMSYEA